MKSKSLNPDLSTINKLIRLIGYKKTTYSEKKEEMIVMLKEMNTFGIRPNLKTFNNCLFVIFNHGNDKAAPELALDILKEMELVKIGLKLNTMFFLNMFYAN